MPRRHLDLGTGGDVQPMQTVRQRPDPARHPAPHQPGHAQRDAHHEHREQRCEQLRIHRRLLGDERGGRQHAQAANGLVLVERRAQRADQGRGRPRIIRRLAGGGQHRVTVLDHGIGHAAALHQAGHDLGGQRLVAREDRDPRRALDGRHHLDEGVLEPGVLPALDQGRAAQRDDRANHPTEQQDARGGAKGDAAHAGDALEPTRRDIAERRALRGQGGTTLWHARRATRPRRKRWRSGRWPPAPWRQRHPEPCAEAGFAPRTSAAPSRR